MILMHMCQNHVLYTFQKIYLCYHWMFQINIWLLIALNVACDIWAKLVTINVLMYIDLTYEDNIHHKLQGTVMIS